jgi:hypothetical protein
MIEVSSSTKSIFGQNQITRFAWKRKGVLTVECQEVRSLGATLEMGLLQHRIG